MIVLVIVVILGALAFVFRAPLTAAIYPPAATATSTVGFVEQAGFVDVIQTEGIQSLYLFAEPNEKAEKVGQVLPGERGELLGQDIGGEWLYVRFGGTTGWAPIYFFNVTAIQ